MKVIFAVLCNGYEGDNFPTFEGLGDYNVRILFVKVTKRVFEDCTYSLSIARVYSTYI